MRAIFMSLVLMGAVVAGAAPGKAEGVLVPDPVPLPSSAESFTDAYGARMVDEFVLILAESTDRACLAARRLEPPSRERAEAWLIRYGQRVLEIAAAFDGRSALPPFIAAFGEGAPAELDALSRHPQVREMLALTLSMRRDRFAELVAAALDRHLLRAGVRLTRRLSAAADSLELLQLGNGRDEAAIQAAQRYIGAHPGVPELPRFMELSGGWTTAAQQAVTDAVLASPVGFEGLVEELRASCITSTPGPAQDVPLPTPFPQPTSAEILAGAYGARLVDEFAAILDASADRACLAERGIASPDRQRALDWLTRYGQRAIDYALAAIDHRAVLAAFARSSGAGAAAEYAALARHPQVPELIALHAPLRLDALADTMAETFDRHLRTHRMRLARPLGPSGSAVQELLILREQREEEASTAIDEYLERNSNVPELQRFLDLTTAWEAAIRSAIDPDAARRDGFVGIIPELRAACIGSPR